MFLTPRLACVMLLAACIWFPPARFSSMIAKVTSYGVRLRSPYNFGWMEKFLVMNSWLENSIVVICRLESTMRFQGETLQIFGSGPPLGATCEMLSRLKIELLANTSTKTCKRFHVCVRLFPCNFNNSAHNLAL